MWKTNYRFLTLVVVIAVVVVASLIWQTLPVNPLGQSQPHSQQSSWRSFNKYPVPTHRQVPEFRVPPLWHCKVQFLLPSTAACRQNTTSSVITQMKMVKKYSRSRYPQGAISALCYIPSPLYSLQSPRHYLFWDHQLSVFPSSTLKGASHEWICPIMCTIS